MFAKACSLARCFTRPVIVSSATYGNTVTSGCGAFVVLNHEGWVATVAHLWEPQHLRRTQENDIRAYEAALKQIDTDAGIAPEEKQKRKAALTPNGGWVKATSFWWGKDGLSLVDVKPLPEADLIVGRLDPFDPASTPNYPVIKDPARNMDPGTGLCRIGFPFHTIRTTYSETGGFALDSACLPLPFFPLEGLFTRVVLSGKTKDGKHDLKMIETSSPGLKGQSGGPIFDMHGTVWGIQSKTKSLPLGFSPKVKRGGHEVEEHQFLNVGEGVHCELLLAFLRDNGIRVQVSVY